MLRTSRRVRSAMVAGMLLVACGEGEPATLPGTYVLRSVNGRDLPRTIISTPSATVAIAAAIVTLFADSTFIDVRRFEVCANGELTLQADTATGTFSLSGDKVNFTTAANDAYQMVWQGTLLTHYAEAVTYRYRK